MNYKKIINDNYTLHLINTDRFKKVDIVVRLTKKYNKKDACFYKLLGRVLTLNGTKKYKTVKELAKQLEYLYNARLTHNFFVTSKNMVIEESISFLNPKYTSKEMYKETINVLKDSLLNQITENNHFKEDIFELEKDDLIKSIKAVKDSPYDYSQLNFEEIFYKDTVYAENNYKNINLFKKIDNDTLYKKYLEIFTEFKIDVFVLGEIDEDIVIKEIDSLMKNFKQKNNYDKDLYIDFKPKKSETKEEYNTNQSNLLIGCTLKNITKYERDYELVLYNTILGCMNNSLLFVDVREKNSLCYSIGSVINRFTNSIVISSGINKKNYEKALKLIKESIKSMEDEKVIKKLITNAKKTLEISFNNFYENSRKIIDYYYINEFTYLPSIEDRRNNILKVDVKDITSLAKKIKINTIYLLEGSINEED